MRSNAGKTRKVKKSFLLVVLMAMVFLLCNVSLAEAQFKSSRQKLLDNNNRFRLEPSFFVGIGTDKIDVGITTTGENVSISGGGGVGGALTLGYGFYEKLDIDLTFGYQHSGLSKDVDNADGSFDRTFLLGTLKYKIPVYSSGQVKFGGGIGYYMPDELDLDLSQVPNGSHDIIKYDNAIGFHITAEYEGFFSSYEWSWIVGIKYYYVTYDADSCTSDGISFPVNFLRDEIRKLDGSGFDFSIAIAKYF
ncbi:MAG: hypothetical protein ACMUIU_08275 [bacterium]